MKPIELERWEPAPDDPRRKVYAGQRTAQEVFEELRYRLEGMGYLPDEYLFMDREWANGREIPRGAEIFCITDYGGSEGIYLDCSLMGKFDDSGRHSLYVGSLKTLYTDLDACKIMGELSGALMYYASCYVNQNIHRYTPDSELLREKQRMEEKAAAKGQ